MGSPRPARVQAARSFQGSDSERGAMNGEWARGRRATAEGRIARAGRSRVVLATVLARWFLIFLLFVALGGRAWADYIPQDGDIVFQVSQSSQSAAIQAATQSPYSHMGIVSVRDGVPFVLEAVQPVKLTPLGQWIARGERRHFVVKRLKNAAAVLTPETLRQMWAVAETFAGKDYDLQFGWSDDRIYCSELVWKIYQRGAGVEIGALATLGTFDLSAPAVRAKLAERYGTKIPLEEIVISPAAIFEARELETVFEQ